MYFYILFLPGVIMFSCLLTCIMTFVRPVLRDADLFPTSGHFVPPPPLPPPIPFHFVLPCYRMSCHQTCSDQSKQSPALADKEVTQVKMSLHLHYTLLFFFFFPVFHTHTDTHHTSRLIRPGNHSSQS